MFTVATWNPTGGFGSKAQGEKSAKPNAKQKKKWDFVREINADLTILSDYGKGVAEKLDFDDHKYSGRVLVGSRRGELEIIMPDVFQKNTIALRYKSKNSKSICLIALYVPANTISKAHKYCNNFIEQCKSCDMGKFGLLVGDFNIWSGLGDSNGVKSKKIHKEIDILGFRSSFHVANELSIGDEKISFIRSDLDPQMTYRPGSPETHIDYIFYSDKILQNPCESRIEGFPKGNLDWTGHAAVVTTFPGLKI